MIRLIIKRSLGFFFLLWSYLIELIVDLVKGGRERQALQRKYIGYTIKLLGIKIKVHGEMPPENKVGVYMSNHRTYLDPIVILNFVSAAAVSKAEVKYWPLIGWCISLGNHIWVERASPFSRKSTKASIVHRVKQKESVLLFPEGTTHLFKRPIGFKRGIFKECALNQMYIFPISVEYQVETDAWISNDNFVRHFLQCFSKKETHVGVFFHKPIKSFNETYLYDYTYSEISYGMTYLRNEFEKQPQPAAHNFDWVYSNRNDVSVA